MQRLALHCLVLDGVYRCDTEGEPVFVEASAPSDEALQTVWQTIITRMMKLLTRKGVLVEEQGQTTMADNGGDSDEARTLRPLQAAACTYRIAVGPRAGQKVLTLQGVMPRAADFRQTLCADIQGNSAAGRRALRCRQPPGAGATVPHHHASGFGQRAGANQRCRTGRAQAQDPLARRQRSTWRIAPTAAAS